MPRTHSPLRYPGGKTQLSNFVIEVLALNKLKNIIYCEPFAGGFGAGLELLFNGKIKEAIINDFDIAIYSIWYAILYETERLLKDLENIQITIEEWEKQKNIHSKLARKKEYSYELAFATYFLNRTNISGIILGGPIGGRKQKGKYLLDCRFNKKSLLNKIERIRSYRDQIGLYNMEANDFINKVLVKYLPNEIFVFYDPPYYEQGKNLYTNFFEHKDHKKLKTNIDKLKDYYWILTYDNRIEISRIYEEYNQYLYNINYSANRARKESELFIHSEKTLVQSFGKVTLRKKSL